MLMIFWTSTKSKQNKIALNLGASQLFYFRDNYNMLLTPQLEPLSPKHLVHEQAHHNLKQCCENIDFIVFLDFLNTILVVELS